jgi:hypothetical protein
VRAGDRLSNLDEPRFRLRLACPRLVSRPAASATVPTGDHVRWATAVQRLALDAGRPQADRRCNAQRRDNYPAEYPLTGLAGRLLTGHPGGLVPDARNLANHRGDHGGSRIGGLHCRSTRHRIAVRSHSACAGDDYAGRSITGWWAACGGCATPASRTARSCPNPGRVTLCLNIDAHPLVCLSQHSHVTVPKVHLRSPVRHPQVGPADSRNSVRASNGG